MTENEQEQKKPDALDSAIKALVGLVAFGGEKAEQVFSELVEKGEKLTGDGRNLVGNLVGKLGEERKAVQTKLTTEFRKMLDAMNLATKDDIARLESLIQELREKKE